MRGKGLKLAEMYGMLGITPAYAGKSRERKKLKSPEKDHPRLCGEKIPRQIHCWDHMGSPPPMRGKVCSTGMPRLIARITPAYAGKSSWLEDTPRPLWDHPRLCGEKA